MKKQYIKPSTTEIRLTAKVQLMAGSADYQASDVTLSSESADNGDAYSRGSSFWDDEE